MRTFVFQQDLKLWKQTVSNLQRQFKVLSSAPCIQYLPCNTVEVWLSSKYSYPRCSTLIQAIDEVELQYDPRFEMPDSTSTLPVSLLQKLVTIVIKLIDEPLRK